MALPLIITSATGTATGGGSSTRVLEYSSNLIISIVLLKIVLSIVPRYYNIMHTTRVLYNRRDETR